MSNIEMNEIINPVDNDQPMIFVTTYSLYSQGKQFKNDFTGFWLSCDEFELNSDIINDSFNIQDPDCLDDHEYMFTDHQNFPSELYSESGIDFDLIEEWQALEDSEKEVIKAYCEHVSNDLKEAINRKDEMYIFDGDLADYAQELTEECNEIPDYLVNYIDYKAMGRDMSYDGNLHEIDRNSLLVIQF